MTAIIKMLFLSGCLTVASLIMPLNGANIVWINDRDFSFFLQVDLPPALDTTIS